MKVAGDLQFGRVGRLLTSPLRVVVRATTGAAIPGAPVTFTVGVGGGSVTLPMATTDAQGEATTTWRLGPTAGTQTVAAALATGSLATITFSATATPDNPVVLVSLGGDGQVGPAGVALPVRPSVAVRDSFGNGIPGIPIAFAVTAGGGIVVGPSVRATDDMGVAAVGDWILGPGGANELLAAAGGVTLTGNPATFTATSFPPGAPASIVVTDGDGQTGLAGYPLNIAPGVRVLDAAGNPVQGVGVTFAVTSGGGSVAGPSSTTDLTGLARPGSWSIQLGSNTLSATAAPGGVAGNPASISATGVVTSFAITVRFVNPPPASLIGRFLAAQALWEQIVFGDLPDLPVTPAAGNCGVTGVPVLDETVDDILVWALIEPIDGPGGILGGAAPCIVRSGGLPAVGIMIFDVADSNLLSSGVAAHEMGHALGFGTRWSAAGLLAGAGGVDPVFTGAQAIRQFDRVGGSSYTGRKVPVENTGDVGTRDAHWRESVFGVELMTGFLEGGYEPLSAVSAGAMEDLGYLVNVAGAQSFTLSARVRAPGPAPLALRDDILRLPVVEVDASGRVVRRP